MAVAEVDADAAQAPMKKNNERDKLCATPSGKQPQSGYYCFRHKSESLRFQCRWFAGRHDLPG